MLMPVMATYSGSNASSPTPEQIQECNSLGISPEKCSEQAILSHRCIGAVGAPCGNGLVSYPKIDPIVSAIMIGSGIALIGGILYVRRIRKTKTD